MRGQSNSTISRKIAFYAVDPNSIPYIRMIDPPTITMSKSWAQSQKQPLSITECDRTTKIKKRLPRGNISRGGDKKRKTKK